MPGFAGEVAAEPHQAESQHREHSGSGVIVPSLRARLATEGAFCVPLERFKKDRLGFDCPFLVFSFADVRQNLQALLYRLKERFAVFESVA